MDVVLIFFSRTGFEDSAIIEGVEANVLLTESLMDGIIDISDSWALALAVILAIYSF